ncbi:MAG: disulfide reductase, partial [Marinilabiliales bacterium]
MKSKIGVYICQCGSNISDYVDVEAVKDIVKEFEGVDFAKVTMFACADSTQKEIVSDIESQGLDGIVIASCSPKLHLLTFRNAAERAGLNPYNYVQVNIREQCSWPHSDNPKKATDKAVQLIKAGIERVKRSEELSPIGIESLNSVLVVGAGIAGMRAAIELGNMGTKVYLIEKEHFIGGRVPQWNKLFTSDEPSNKVIEKLYAQIINHSNIELYTGAEMTSKNGSVGNFTVDIQVKSSGVNKETVDASRFDQLINSCKIEVPEEFNFGLTKRKAIYKNQKGQYPEGLVIDFENCTKCGDCQKGVDFVTLEDKTETLNLKVGALLLATGSDPYTP